MIDIDPKILEELRKSMPQKIAEEICSVQPMPNDVYSKWIDSSMSEKDLIEQGYEPIDPLTRLMWRKK